MYASIADGLCFIDFATKCFGKSDPDFYNIQECEGTYLCTISCTGRFFP
jgi:hypothetical protein